MKRIPFVIASALAMSACASLQNVPACLPQPEVAPQPVPAWILEPAPNLQSLLDVLISPSETVSIKSAPSLQPVKAN